ncbi:MAG: 4-hydroxy-tetrahydrodipicolinate synthase [Bacteroidales bacterium]|nr:4-hydroxy-tetrahydrodipicolinate synthase [Bacteroidales bacterium]
MNTFVGTGVALVTPFDKEKKVDHISLKKLVNYVIDGKVEYLVVMGTTAESPVISDEEKKEILHTVIEANNHRVRIVFGVGGNDTHKVIQQLEFVNNHPDIDAILSVTPYYNKPNQRALIEHFSAIAENCTKPIILYNVPGRTGINMLPETTLTLANKYNHIVAIKEASGNFDQIMQIIEHKPSHFDVISGDDGITLPLISVGVKGVISVVANAIPLQFSEMVRLALSNQIEKARQLHYQTLELSRLAFAEGSPSGIKCTLWHLGIIQNELRLPLVPVSESLSNKIQLWIHNNLKK